MITADSAVKLASFPGHSQIYLTAMGKIRDFLHSCEIKSGGSLGTKATVKHDGWQSICSPQNVNHLHESLEEWLALLLGTL